jgi:hypothetical protein
MDTKLTTEVIVDLLMTMVTANENGSINPIDLKISIKELTDTLEAIDKQIKPQLLEEAFKFNKQDYNGFRIDIVDGGGRYSYDHIPDWVTKNAELKAIEQQSQIAYKSNEMIMMTDDGEVISAAKFNPTATYIKMTKAKN